MKKRNVFVATCVTLMLVAGCSAQKGEVSSAAPTQIVSTSIAESTLDVSSTKSGENRMAEEESTLTGTISDIKDFMFVITDGDGVDYVLSFEGEKPEGQANMGKAGAVFCCRGNRAEQEECKALVYSVPGNAGGVDRHQCCMALYRGYI